MMPKTKLTYHTQHGDGDGDDNGILGIHLIRVVARAYFTYTYTYTHRHALVSPELKMPARRTCDMRGGHGKGHLRYVRSRHRCLSLPLPLSLSLLLLSCLRLRLAAVRQIARQTILRVCRRACVCVSVCRCVSVSTVCAATVALFQVYWLTSVKGSTY